MKYVKENDKFDNNQNKSEKVKCDLCNKEMNRSNLPRHKKTMTCKKMWEYVLDSD
tara:strand:+ start:2436 stop:2600 length:165 start_codon:yes stop_codon:yes gene_type:complete